MVALISVFSLNIFSKKIKMIMNSMFVYKVYAFYENMCCDVYGRKNKSFILCILCTPICTSIPFHGKYHFVSSVIYKKFQKYSLFFFIHFLRNFQLFEIINFQTFKYSKPSKFKSKITFETLKLLNRYFSKFLKVSIK